MTSPDDLLNELTALQVSAAKIAQARAAAEVEILQLMAVSLSEGREDEVHEIYLRVKPLASQGFHERWQRTMPVALGAFANRGAHLRKRQQRATANGAGGHSWQGVVPILAADPIPPPGLAVVYVLFDATNKPIYVGSTGNFRTRISAHLRGGKLAARWMAYPCADRGRAPTNWRVNSFAWSGPRSISALADLTTETPRAGGVPAAGPTAYRPTAGPSHSRSSPRRARAR